MPNNDSKTGRNLPHARKRARERSLQALYQWDVNNSDASDIIQQFEQSQDMRNADVDYFKKLVCSTIDRVDALDKLLEPYCKIDFEQLDPVERSVLRLSVNELANYLEVPYRVVVNEGVELAKRYGGSESHKFVNGVLDKAAKELRSAEMKAD